MHHRLSGGKGGGKGHTPAEDSRQRSLARFFGGKAKADASISGRLQGAADTLDDSAEFQQAKRASVQMQAQGSGSFTRQLSKAEGMVLKAQGSKFFKELDRETGLTHSLTRGHKDRVTCVCADVGADTIVTGSVDGTARVWMFEQDCSTYILFAVITHIATKPAKGLAVVTAAAVLEGEALVVTGTSEGDVCFTDLSVPDIGRLSRLHKGPVKELAIRNDGMQTIAIQLKADKNHNIGVELLAEDRGFLVEKILGGGVIQQWNEANPTQAIKVGDVFTSVNGRDLRAKSKDDEDMEATQVMDGALQEGVGQVELNVWRHTDGEILVASCGGTTVKLLSVHSVKTKFRSDAPYTYRVESTMRHDKEVAQVRFVRAGRHIDEGAWRDVILYVVSASEEGAHLWSRNGAKIATFAMDEAGTQGMAIPLRDESVLVTAGGGKLCVWDLGKINPHGADCPSSATAMLATPEREYEHKHSDIDVTLKGESLVDSHQHMCVLWKLIPDDGSNPVGKGLEERLLPKSKVIESKKQLCHASPVSCLHVVEDPDDGGVLVAGCNDGRVVVWDLEGKDSGEVIARLRSLGMLEFLTPIIMLFISFLQMSSFAFGPAVPWAGKVQHTTSVITPHGQPSQGSSSWMSFITPLVRLNLVVLLGGDGETKFWASTVAVLAVMATFLTVVIGDVRLKLMKMREKTLSGEHFQKEFERRQKKQQTQKSPRQTKKTKKKQKNRAEPGCGHSSHWKLWLINHFLSFVTHLISGCCSVLVVPMATSLAQALSCHQATDGRLVLTIEPKIQCFVGAHWNLVVATAVIAPLYFFLLFPYAMVKGDADYVQRGELLSFQAWEDNAVRKATVIHLGPMHPDPEHVGIMVCSDVACKIALPLVAKLTITNPVLQMSLITPIGFYYLAISYYKPVLMEDCWNIILLGGRFWMFSAMVCALLVTLAPGRIEPSILLAVSSVLVPIITFHNARLAPAVMDHKQVLRLSVSGSKRLQGHYEEP